jgi:hypothetical protein
MSSRFPNVQKLENWKIGRWSADGFGRKSPNNFFQISNFPILFVTELLLSLGQEIFSTDFRGLGKGTGMCAHFAW